MEMHTIKLGLGAATAIFTGIVMLFALYVQIGAMRRKAKVAVKPSERHK